MIQRNAFVDNIIAGSLGGFFSVCICHPIDVLRTRLQLSPSSVSECFSTIIKNDGVRGFYKGFMGPFCAQGIYKSVAFATNGSVHQHVFKSSNSSQSIYISGMSAGFVNAFIVSPVELIRTTRIVSSRETSSTSKSTAAVIKSLVSRNGWHSLWRGVIPTMIRDSPGMGFYFLTFNKTKPFLAHITGKSEGNIWVKILSGSMAGICFWSWALPIDTIKTTIEHNFASAPTAAGTKASSPFSLMWSTGYDLVTRGGGLWRLYQAWPMALGRGIPAAAITLTTYDLCMQYLVNQPNS